MEDIYDNGDMEIEETAETKLNKSFKDLLDELDRVEIKYNTAETIYQNLMTHITLAEGHVDNNESLRDSIKKKFEIKRNDKNIQEMAKETNTVPKEMVQLIAKAYHYLDETHVWQRLQIESLLTFCEKLFREYMSTKTFEIHNATEKGFEKRQQEWMDLVKENTKTMFNNVDSKFDGFKNKFIETEKYINEIDKKMMRIELHVESLQHKISDIRNNEKTEFPIKKTNPIIKEVKEEPKDDEIEDNIEPDEKVLVEKNNIGEDDLIDFGELDDVTGIPETKTKKKKTTKKK